MTLLLAADCGAHSVGLALYQDKELQAATYLGHPSWGPWDVVRAVRRWLDPQWLELSTAVETMQIYPGQAEIDVNDLLAVNLVAGGILAMSARCTAYKPREWKGTMKKEACHVRALERLTAVERKRFDLDLECVAASKRHNVLDAVGIGLFALGRFDRKRVYPGATP